MASDHAGFELKQCIIQSYSQFNDLAYSQFIDLGTHDGCSVDYPDYAHLLCQQLRDDQTSLGILICGTGIGMSIVANRHPHIRAAVCNEGSRSAQLARAHNNANVLCLGARLIDTKTALASIDVFLTTSFEGGRHQNRIDKINPTLEK